MQSIDSNMRTRREHNGVDRSSPNLSWDNISGHQSLVRVDLGTSVTSFPGQDKPNSDRSDHLTSCDEQWLRYYSVRHAPDQAGGPRTW